MLIELMYYQMHILFFVRFGRPDISRSAFKFKLCYLFKIAFCFCLVDLPDLLFVKNPIGSSYLVHIEVIIQIQMKKFMWTAVL